MKKSIQRRHERGSAMLVVLILLVLLSLLAMGNGLTMHQLQRELRQIDLDQQKRLLHPVEQKRWTPPARR